jgi:hypothetical protein
MSRRHHGGRPHRSNAPGRPLDTSRPLGPIGPAESPPIANPAGADTRPDGHGAIAPTVRHEERIQTPPAVPFQSGPTDQDPAGAISVEPPHGREDGAPFGGAGGSGSSAEHDARYGSATPARPGPMNGLRPSGSPGLGSLGACTAPQLRRFIKSRPYVPMHELRRRFGINGGEDEVTPVALSSGMIYVGLPSREGSLLGELLRGGEVGYELSLDPRSPVVVGLYPMRPVARG